METEQTKDYEVVEFRPEYQDQIIDLISKTLRDQKVISDGTEPIDDEDLRKIPQIYSGRGRFWVAIKDSKVIGTIAIREMEESIARLNRMFVSTEHHGTGIGQSLLNQTLSFAKQQGFKEVTLNTHPLMKRAHNFYEKNGFQKTGEDKDRFNYKRYL